MDEEPGGVSSLFEDDSGIDEMEGKRWFDGGFVKSDLCVITEDVMAVHNGSQIRSFLIKQEGKIL